ncbi:MAG: DUF4418 family protein [Acetatifactor sp.]|nr:DUF4418 family protein [Acetatifactor sp.]
MKDKKLRLGGTDVVLLIVTTAYWVLLLTVFQPCGPKEDGSYMVCHWAGNAILSFNIILEALAIVHLFFRKEGIKAGISIALIVVSGVGITLPGGFIPLCMMETMRCNQLTRPANTIFAVFVIIVAAVDFWLLNKRGKE